MGRGQSWPVAASKRGIYGENSKNTIANNDLSALSATGGIARSASTTGAFSPKFQGINIKLSDNWPTSKLVVPCEKQL
jgi:hypothetical protein